MPKTRLLLADDHPLFLQGLVSLLGTENEFELVATVASGPEALAVLEAKPVDVCILDINMPGMSGIETAQQIRDRKISTRIIALTTYSDPEFVKAMAALEVSGYVLKNSTGAELVTAIRKVMQGESYFSKEISDSITQDFFRNEKKKTVPAVTLTPRETEIVRLLAREQTNDEIATALFISYRTVETHRKNIMHKTGAKNLAGLIHFAIANGLLAV